MSASTAIEVMHNVAAQRFETRVDGLPCQCAYQLMGNVMRLVHTEVPQALSGRGIAGVLVKAALDYARAHNLQVVPACSYVRAYFERHAEVRDLLAAR
jgi:predicted GNAT family acetyltransferase